MNKHTRLVASLLFIFIIVLTAAITRFYFSVPENTSSSNDTAQIVRRLDTDASGNRIFEDGSGSCGIADSRDRIIVAPEWMELSFAGEGRCIAAKHIGSKTLYGCIDYEGNIVVPVIYRSITQRGDDSFRYYTAVSEKDDTVVIYGEDFSPLFRRSWDSCVAGEEEIVLSTGMGIYTYSTGEQGMLLKSATVTGETMGCSYTFDISSRLILSRLDVNMLERIAESVGRYLEYAYKGDIEQLSDITVGSYSGFTMLFPNDHKILSKRLLKVPDIYIYLSKGENSQPGYEVAMVTDTELTYSDDKGETKTMREEYRASMKFTGSSETDITAVSGSFLQTAPDYPQPEPPEEEPEGTTAASGGKKPDPTVDTRKKSEGYDGSADPEKIRPAETTAPH